VLNPCPIPDLASCGEKTDSSQPFDELQPLGESKAFGELSQRGKSQRYGLPDAMRGIAALFIVWHHLTLYAPQSDLADIFAPELMFFLYNRALYAVQVFMVIGGFSLAVSVSEWPQSLYGVLQKLVTKYLRVGIPCMVMLASLLLTSYLFRACGLDLGLVENVSLGQILSSVFFLQDVLGYGNIAAGTWYLCIDLQYSLLFMMLYWLVGRFVQNEHRGPLVLAILLFGFGLMGAFFWNGRLEYEPYISYFLAPFVLGTLIGFSVRSRISSQVLCGYGIALLVAWVLQPRPQLAVAMVAGAVLWGGALRYPDWQIPRWLKWLGDRSYSLFLVHYGVNGVVLILLNPWAITGPGAAFASMWIAFAASLVVTELFWRWVEVPSLRISKQLQRHLGTFSQRHSKRAWYWVPLRRSAQVTTKIS
jgi:peptidoglycan/LPS O-acetylase OafA/YrhL